MIKTLDPEYVRALLGEYQDVLTPAIKAEEALYENTQCPVCGQSDCEKKVNAPKVVIGEDGTPHVAVSPFGSGMLPNGFAHCRNCETDFNPHTGLIFRSKASIIHAPR